MSAIGHVGVARGEGVCLQDGLGGLLGGSRSKGVVFSLGGWGVFLLRRGESAKQADELEIREEEAVAALVAQIKVNMFNIWPKINTLISSFNFF